MIDSKNTAKRSKPWQMEHKIKCCSYYILGEMKKNNILFYYMAYYMKDLYLFMYLFKYPQNDSFISSVDLLFESKE